jgi:hypothetical protein
MRFLKGFQLTQTGARHLGPKENQEGKMLLPRFEFHEPATVEEACRILGELGEKAKTLAGGTDLLVNMKKKVLAPEHVVSLDRIESLSEMATSNGMLRIGACAKAAEIAESEAVRRFSGVAGRGIQAGLPFDSKSCDHRGKPGFRQAGRGFSPPH